MARILVVDDEAKVRAILKIMISAKGHDVEEAPDGNEALSKLETEAFDMAITDIRMGGLDGMGLLKALKERDIGCPVVFITAYASLESAVEALRLGAADYLVKPFEEKQVLLAVERALGVGRIMSENVRLKKALSHESREEDSIFVSRAMKDVERTALKVAPSMSTVLISGESGTGKEVVARLIHRMSSMCDGRFVDVNCAAISPTLVESELFGHEKGAFTGADRRKEGKFEFADGGTLFLDEVGDLPLDMQAKLLRAIQEKSVQRVGGNRTTPVDTRLICATNQDLEGLVTQGKFREDLYYRIAVFPIHVPPLRERRSAIVHLATYFIKKVARVREGINEVLTAGAARMLMEYPWPGNVRELANAMERAVISKSGRLPVTSDDLSFLQREGLSISHGDGLIDLPPTGMDFDKLQRSVISQAMRMTAGNQSAAARLLGLSRARLRTMLKLSEE
jgi:DNA-binding NtrC family response regulator